MRILLIFFAVASFAACHVTAITFGDTRPLSTNSFLEKKNSQILIPTSTGQAVLEELKNAQLNLDTNDQKNIRIQINDFPTHRQNLFQKVNSLAIVPNLPAEDKEKTSLFQPQQFSVTPAVPELPSTFNGFLRQEFSNGMPITKQQNFGDGNRQFYNQQFNNYNQKQQLIRSDQQLSVHNQRKSVSHQQSLNNQQMRVGQRQFPNFEDKSINDYKFPNGKQSPINQQQFLEEQQKLSDERHFLGGHVTPESHQESTGNRNNFFNNQQESSSQQQRFFNMQNSAGQLHFQRIHPQQPVSRQQELDQRHIFSLNQQSTIRSSSRPQQHTLGQFSRNLGKVKGDSHTGNKFEHLANTQFQTPEDRILTQIRTQALSGAPQHVNIVNYKDELQTINPSVATSHQTSLTLGLQSSPLVSALAQSHGADSTLAGIQHKTRLISSASVKQHMKTPYAAYEFGHHL